MIRFVVEPLSIIDDIVGHFGAGQQGKGADHFSPFVHHHVATTHFDVFPKHVIARIAVGPLEGVAIAAHDFTRLVAKAEDDGQVSQGGFADGVTHLWPNSKTVK